MMLATRNGTPIQLASANNQARLGSFASDFTVGIMAAPKRGVILPFQLLPMTLDIKKSTNYDTISITGMDHQIMNWSHGSLKSISFELSFHSTEAAKNIGFPTIGLPIVQLLHIEAIMEMMVKPIGILEWAEISNELQLAGSGISGLFRGISRSVAKAIDQLGMDVMLPPPEVTVILGMRWFRGKISSFSFKESAFTPVFYAPRDITSSVSMTVIDSGTFIPQATDAIKKVTGIFSSLVNQPAIQSVLADSDLFTNYG